MKFLKPTSRVMLYIALSFLGSVVVHGQTTTPNLQKQRKSKKERLYDDAIERFNFEYNKIKDPRTGKVPDDIRRKELKFSKKIRAKKSFSRTTTKSKQFSDWKHRGPFNVGGRTRALAIDITNEDIIFAGGVSGGLWKTVDRGQNWTRILQGDQDLNITTIVQDPREGMRNIWYYGTGEVRGNTATARGAVISGNGIYKSIDGGNTWQLLASTADGDVTRSNAFGIVNSMAIHPINGDVYVAGKKGIYRSQDGGITFTPVLGTTNDIEYSEIVVTSTGRLYATIDRRGNPVHGFYTSLTGNADDWTSITPDIFNNRFYRRTVMAITPSNENLVYFFSRHDRQPQATTYSLMKYTVNQDTIANSTWTNLSANLPIAIGPGQSNLNSQGSYNMMIKVHPTNPDIIFVGGTNLYRSFTGFTTPFPNVAQGVQDWIGGYKPSQTGDADIYTNHHPDQHNLVFFPSNSNMALSANDSGVFITNDITRVAASESVTWTSLNNGYQTTQVYDLSFDPNATNEHILSGFQDNATYFTSSGAPTAIWDKVFSGDGGVNHIADNGNTRYVSAQNGFVVRQNLNAVGEVVSRIKVVPEGPPKRDYLFITPYILDRNNDNIMYMAIKDRVWRNNNLDSIPLSPQLRDTPVNWLPLSSPRINNFSTVSTLEVSTYPIANRLYYGTQDGDVYRVDNANLGSHEVVKISTGKHFRFGSHVEDIAVDPSNSDRLIVVFSNYGIPSILLSNDAGNTWQDISGNLEENADGTGNGPSVRSAAFYEGSQVEDRLQKIYVGTSTGLYYTTGDLITRGKVKWTREDTVIGEALVRDIDIRKDGFIAVGTHGSGIYSAKFPLSQPLPQPKLRVTRLLEDFTVTENSADTQIDISNLFQHSEQNPISIRIVNSNPALVTATINNGILTISYTANTIGMADIDLIATSGIEQVAEGVKVTVDQEMIYSQLIGIQEVSYPSFLSNLAGTNKYFTADDFIVPEGETWTIERVKAFGINRDVPIHLIGPAKLILYSNDFNDLQQNIIYENDLELLPNINPFSTTIDLELTEPQILQAGTYWITIAPYVNSGNINGRRWHWYGQIKNPGIGERAQAKVFGDAPTDWTPIPVDPNDPMDPGIDMSFQIFGSVAPAVPNPVVNSIPKNTIVSPNPSSDIFTFHLENVKGTGTTSIIIHNFWGNEVYSKSNIHQKANVTWDASHMSQGIYFVTIERGKVTEKIKIIKK